MIVWVALGIPKLSTVEIPIFAEVQAASGVVRAQVELISDPPFVKYDIVNIIHQLPAELNF